MKADFESAIEDVKIAFSDFKEVLVVILYGSVSRGDFSTRHSDLDLFVVVNKKKVNDKLKNKIYEKISSVCFTHAVRAHLEFQGLTITHEDQTLVAKMIEEGKVIYSSGIWVFNNELIGLKQYILYSFSAKESKKRTLFSKALYGKKSWYYKGKEKIVKEYPGIIDNETIILIGKGGLLVSKAKQKDMEYTFNEFDIKYKVKRIVYA